MHILLYTDSDDNAVNDSLLSNFKSKVSAEYIESIDHMEKFTKRVHRLPKGIDIAVFLARDKECLCDLVSLKDFLDGISIILLLPDLEKDIVLIATKLYPSFMSKVDSDLGLVSDVLGNMFNLRKKLLNEKGTEPMTKRTNMANKGLSSNLEGERT
jgi:hypothetical protein